jgi:asparagine synthase (glutamine-hydrolysing)
MCGIAGTFTTTPSREHEVADGEVRPLLAHRGPDHFGSWLEPGVTLRHWRLAIIDLSPAGNQPMVSSDERFVICYNGEVYNFEELRIEIEDEWRRAAGSADDCQPRERSWRGRSDTEVIVEGFSLWGSDFLSRLNGMFALALYDRMAQRLYLSRDRAGIKPLYVWQNNDVLLFASEAKCFLRVEAFDTAITADGLAAFFTYGHCFGEHHVLRDVRQIEPGEVMTVSRTPDQRALVVHSHRAPRPRWNPVSRTDESAAAELRTILSAAVARQLVADVPVGVLLSGGVDSSILTALSARLMGPGKTMAFTLGYPGAGPDYDEIEYSRRVAKHLGVQHYVYEASPDDLVQDVEQLVWHYDEPFADAAALNVFLISRMIRSKVTVALAGEGSDELFGGYRRYHLEQAIRTLGMFGVAAAALVRAAHLDRAAWLPRRGQILLRAMAKRGASARYSSYLESEVSIEDILKPAWHTTMPVQASIRDSYPDDLRTGIVGHLCLADQQFWLPGTYLEKSDKGGMAHGLEIRVPFLDNEVVEFANTLPDNQRIRGRSRKWLLKEAFRDWLPGEVFGRFKRGFGVPVGRWLRTELRDYYVDHVLSPRSRVRQFLQMPAVEGCFRDHGRGARDYSGLLWKTLVLEIWLRHCERRFQRTVTSRRPVFPSRQQSESPRRPTAVASA